MLEKVRAFSVVLGPSGSEFTAEELESRKKVARDEILALMPSAKYLMNSMLRECVFAEEGKIVLAYDLVEISQLPLDFNADGKKKRLSVLNRLLQDAQRLRESAEQSQVRIAELTSLVTQMNSDPLESHTDFDMEDRSLLHLMYSNRGKSIHIKYPDDEIILQLPDIPIYVPEDGIRKIRFKVESISKIRATVEVGEGIMEESDRQVHQPLPKKIVLHRQRNNELNEEIWPYLYPALENRLYVEAQVKVSLHAESRTPAYLELLAVLNNVSLRKEIFRWTSPG